MGFSQCLICLADEILLLSTMLPLSKDKMGDKCSSKNYRAICICSLLLKIFDWIVILLYGDLLHLNELQFGYQQNCSTTMFTWAALETLSYFSRNNSNVFMCLMDMSKAFDTVKHSMLFRKLVDGGLPPIYIS